MNIEQTFLDIMVQVLSDAQSIFTDLYDDNNLAWEQVEERTFLNTTTFVQRPVRRLLYWSIAYDVMFNLEVEHSAITIGEFLSSQKPFCLHINEVIGTSFMNDRIRHHELLEQILRWYLMRKGSFKRDSRLLRTIFLALRRHFNSKTITSTYHQFLANVVPKSKQTSFGAIRLVRLGPKELQTLCNNNAYFRWFFDSRDHHPSRPAMAMLTLSIQDRKIIGERDLSTVQTDRYFQFRNIVNSIRLVSKSPIGSSGFQMESHIRPFFNIDGAMGTPSYCRLRTVDQLDTTSLRSAQATYKLLSAVGCNKSDVAKLALSRLESADGRNSPEDQILDLFIGFEAIVLGHLWKQGDVQGELKFRLSLTTSKYLGRNREDSERIYRAMRRGYDLRSSIIHGNTIEAAKLSETLSELSNIYRNLIRKWSAGIVRGTLPDPTKLLI